MYWFSGPQLAAYVSRITAVLFSQQWQGHRPTTTWLKNYLLTLRFANDRFIFGVSRVVLEIRYSLSPFSM